VTQATGTAGPTGPMGRTRTRPLGVVLLVLFQLGNIAANLAAVGGLLGPRMGSLVGVFGNQAPVLDYLFVGLAFLSFVGAIALWRFHRFGWYAVMLLTGLGLAVQLALYVWATPNFVNMAIFAVSAFYLNQREVKEIFLSRPADPEPVILEAEQGGQL
jgi:hypothetical protein